MTLATGTTSAKDVTSETTVLVTSARTERVASTIRTTTDTHAGALRVRLHSESNLSLVSTRAEFAFHFRLRWD